MRHSSQIKNKTRARVRMSKTPQRIMVRRKRARRRATRRVLHFCGFLLFWGAVLLIAYLATLAAMIAFVCLAAR